MFQIKINIRALHLKQILGHLAANGSQSPLTKVYAVTDVEDTSLGLVRNYSEVAQ